MNGLTYIEAIEAMYDGNEIQYIGTVNGVVYSDSVSCFRMYRGIVVPEMVYDPDFRYKCTGNKHITRLWYK